MRYSVILFFLFLFFAGGVISCKKWEDPVSTVHPELDNHYCNDPDAVNYNIGFPGIPDNDVCYYPTDLFVGSYKFFDTVTQPVSQLFLSADSFYLIISKISKRKMGVSGLCKYPNMTSISFTAGEEYMASVDTTVGDSLTEYPGQQMCRYQDTVVGRFTRDKFDSSLIYVDLTVRSDTGTTFHHGRARRQY